MLQSKGINDLLSAEKLSQQKIEEARKSKNKRLKEAQNEAKTEIERFKNERDGHYKALEKEVRPPLSSVEKKRSILLANGKP